MDDKQDDACIYVPASIMENRVQSRLALLDARVTKERAVNAFKDVGVYEDRYDMIGLSDEVAGYDKWFGIAFMAALCAALLLAIRLLWDKITVRFRLLRECLRDSYPAEFLSGSFKELLKALCLLIALLAAAAALMWLLTQNLDAALALSELSLKEALNKSCTPSLRSFFAIHHFVKMPVPQWVRAFPKAASDEKISQICRTAIQSALP